jgi:molecular chaperone HscC
MSVVYGVDLGTTYTKCALHEGDRTHVFSLDVELDDLRGAKGLPQRLAGLRSSVTLAKPGPAPVYFVGNRAVVARERFARDKTDHLAIEEAKLFIGTRLGMEGSVGGPPWYFGDADLRPEDAGALVLSAVARSVLEAGKPPLTRMVVTHPAQFDATQQQATRHAAALANIEVVDLLTEPEAAAIAYSRELKEDGRYLIFDLGGGTLDLVLVEVVNRQFRTVGKVGGKIGGRDFDREILKKMYLDFNLATSDQFREHMLSPPDVTVWMGYAERIKRSLNGQSAEGRHQQVSFVVPFDSTYALEAGLIENPLPESFRFVWSLHEYESEIAGLVDDCRRLVGQMLADYRIDPSQLRGIISVGGSTKLKLIQSLLDELSGGRTLRSLDPDTVVAQGAAIHASNFATSGASVELADLIKRTPYRGRLFRSVGVRAEGRDGESRLVTLVRQNTETPLSKPVEKTFSILPNQEFILVQLYEGEDSDPDSPENNFIGACRIDGFKVSPKAQSVIVRLHIEGNDTKRVTVKLGDFEKEVPIEFDPAKILSQHEIVVRRQFVDGLRLQHG